MKPETSNKEKYAAWAETQPFLPLTMQPWWMDAVCAGKQWDVLLVENEQGEILGALPYLIRRRLWLNYIVMPQQTQIGGIWISGEYTDDQWVVAEVCRRMAEQLGQLHLAYYYQQYPSSSYCVEPMRALGFRTRERVTYRIEDLSDLDKVISRFSKNKKRQLQKALSLHAERGCNPEDFYRFHANCMHEQHKRITYSREFFLVLERKLRRRNQCEILTIKDADNHIHAAAFLVWDNRVLYYQDSCYTSEGKMNGARELMKLEAIKMARILGVKFDFCSERVGKSFGANPIVYFGVSYCKWKISLPHFVMRNVFTP